MENCHLEVADDERVHGDFLGRSRFRVSPLCTGRGRLNCESVDRRLA